MCCQGRLLEPSASYGATMYGIPLSTQTICITMQSNVDVRQFRAKTTKYLTYMLDFIVMQMSRGNRKKGY